MMTMHRAPPITTAVESVHGHAHHGAPEGSIGEVPVRNVAVHVTGQDFLALEL